MLELSEKSGLYVDLASVPSPVWDRIADRGFDAVWLMGVWQRSPAGIAIANRNDSLLDDLTMVSGFSATGQHRICIQREPLRCRSAFGRPRRTCVACDGVRCDMAMLLLNSIFEGTWDSRAGLKPTTEYWAALIAAVNKSVPEFIAEAYWDREWELQQQGFDYCYDKRLYDHLIHGNTAEVRSHLSTDI